MSRISRKGDSINRIWYGTYEIADIDEKVIEKHIPIFLMQTY
jgi:hypothetical protein